MEAKVQSELPRGDAWQYEPKWDGFRAVAFKDGDEVVIHSRNQKPLNRYFPELVPAIQRIKPKRAVLDGEIVIFTGFGTDFDAMTLRIHPAASRVNMLAKEQPAPISGFTSRPAAMGGCSTCRPGRARRAWRPCSAASARRAIPVR